MRNFCWHKVTPNADRKLLKRFGAGFRKLLILKRTLKIIVCGYALAEDATYSMRVCNDSTVRGIKLVTDFFLLLLKEENLQNRVFIMEDNLRKIPNQRKRPFQFV